MFYILQLKVNSQVDKGYTAHVDTGDKKYEIKADSYTALMDEVLRKTKISLPPSNKVKWSWSNGVGFCNLNGTVNEEKNTTVFDFVKNSSIQERADFFCIDAKKHEKELKEIDNFKTRLDCAKFIINVVHPNSIHETKYPRHCKLKCSFCTHKPVGIMFCGGDCENGICMFLSKEVRNELFN